MSKDGKPNDAQRIDRFLDYLHGELADDQAQALEQQLRDDPDALAQLADLAGLMMLTREVYQRQGAARRELESDAAAGLDNSAALQVLQELAGSVTPFTEKVEAEIREAVQAEHDAALAAQQKAAAAELAEVRQKTRAELAAQVKARLVELASRKKG